MATTLNVDSKYYIPIYPQGVLDGGIAFGKYLMTKGTWKLISIREIWKQILTHKYISSTTIEN